MIYRKELRPVITTGAEVMDDLFRNAGETGEGVPAVRQERRELIRNSGR